MSLKRITNPASFRTNIRSKFLDIVPNEKICTNLEIAIYNYAIREATQKKIIKKWENPSFVVLYLDRIRTIYRNLSNQEFLSKITSGEITPQDAAFMTHQEMNEGRWSELIERKKLLDANKFNTNLAASTTLFTCSKCKSNRCTFYSLQIRSCDEGETIFITCMDCGKRWKKNS
jgi:DNA-directed RNA polymerase subunit M/transcription elongation factor TFIIS